ncbi:GyrI-like domain-containing protein [Paenibacillus donghaensis]|uniref:AraC effector-binding domain-containing protein n=1 Tax=Paenibacillus donghaensis TaxID=414771 RepID=A0A2Z2KG74_9BACL|nr:GyrI-like domain-containing protein [Paenibacillus donghaensis]ASA25174.1 hypothetical protein B9T62_33235 [Paenibacillus donghaensis]
MSEHIRNNEIVRDTESYAPKSKPRVIEMIQAQLARQQLNTGTIGGETPYILDLPELQVIGWENSDEAGTPYSDLWSHVFGEFDIDARFDSIPSKVQGSGCYLGIFQQQVSVPPLWEASAWDTGFMLAVEVESGGCIPKGLIKQTFASSKYAIFIARGIPDQAFQTTCKLIKEQWLPSSEYRFNPDGVFFINYTEKSGPSDERFEAHLCVPVVRK